MVLVLVVLFRKQGKLKQAIQMDFLLVLFLVKEYQLGRIYILIDESPNDAIRDEIRHEVRDVLRVGRNVGRHAGRNVDHRVGRNVDLHVDRNDVLHVDRNVRDEGIGILLHIFHILFLVVVPYEVHEVQSEGI